MKTIIYYILISFSFLLQSVQSQVSQEWVKRYNFSSDNWDGSYGIAVDKSGNSFVTGYSYVTPNTRNLITIKYSSAGIQEWVQRYGIGLAHEICIDDFSNVYITGVTSDSGNAVIVALKYDSNGNIQWASAYDGSLNGIEDGLDIAIDKDYNVYVAGYAAGNGAYTDFITIKYNSSGVREWTARYGASYNGEAHSIAVDSLGNVYVTGTGLNTIKYNSSGVQQWAVSYEGSGTAYDIKLDKSNNVYVSGYIYQGSQGGNNNYIIIKYNSLGIQQWAQIYNGPVNEDDVSQWMTLDSTGNIYVAGYSSFGMPFWADYTIIKYNPAGVKQWTAKYNGPGSGGDYARNITIDNSGDIYVTGYSVVPVGGTFDFATVKYNGLTGTEQWVKLYNGTGDSSDYGWSLAVDNNYNVYVTGASFGNGTGRDIATIKYSQTVAIQPISGEIPTQYSLGQNFPNPFNPSTKIKFEIPYSAFTKIAVYDILGREVSILAQEQLKAGIYEVNWNSNNFTSGVYFYSIHTLNYTNTKKMVLIK